VRKEVSKPRLADSVPLDSACILGGDPSFVAQQGEGFPFNPLGARISRSRVEKDLSNGTPKVRYLAIASVQLLKHFFRSDGGQGVCGEHSAIVASFSRQRKGPIWRFWYGSPGRKQRQQ
jgi:hypothetical protein